MSARLQDIEICRGPGCKQPVQHKGGVIRPNVKLVHDIRKVAPIRLCMGCFFAYRARYENQGWQVVEQAKVAEP